MSLYRRRSLSELTGPLLVVALVVMLMCLAKWHTSIHLAKPFVNLVNDESAWLQPASLNSVDFPPISNGSWHINFATIDAIIESLDTANDSLLKRDASTLDTLERVYNELNQTGASYDQQRLFLLIEKGFPGSRGSDVTALLRCYLPYQTEFRRRLATINSSKGGDQLSLIQSVLNTLDSKQARCFGADDAGGLFKRSNASFRFLMGSRLINLDNELSSEQKGSQLKALQDQYRHVLHDL